MGTGPPAPVGRGGTRTHVRAPSGRRLSWPMVTLKVSQRAFAPGGLPWTSSTEAPWAARGPVVFFLFKT